jgi:hypothetical protein
MSLIAELRVSGEPFVLSRALSERLRRVVAAVPQGTVGEIDGCERHGADVDAEGSSNPSRGRYRADQKHGVVFKGRSTQAKVIPRGRTTNSLSTDAIASDGPPLTRMDALPVHPFTVSPHSLSNRTPKRRP